MFDFEALSHAMASQTVLCVGDLMLDEFVYGEVSRISPEAPAPVIAVQRSETNIGGAGNVARNIASLGARCIFVGLIGEDDAGAALKAALARESRIESVLVADPSRPTTRKVRFVSEHFSTHMLRADWELAQPAAAEIEQKLIDAILPQLAARRHRAAVRLCQGRADRAGDPQRHRRRAQTRQARDRRSQERQFRDLSRRDAADAQPQGICRSDPQPRRHRKEHRRRRAGRDAAGGLRSDPGDAERARHDAGAAQGRGDPCAGASGQGARRLRRRRHRGRGAGGDACRRCRLGNRVADGECGGRGCRQQEGHRHRDVSRIAAKNPAACVSGGGRKDRRGGRRPRCASGGVAQAGPAGRLHQWLFRHPASRPRQGADRGARRLRPADRRPQQRRLGEAAEGRGAPGAGRARARRSAGGAGGGRSRRRSSRKTRRSG